MSADAPLRWSCHLVCVPPTVNHQKRGLRIIKVKSGKSIPTAYDTKELAEAKRSLEGMLQVHQPPAPVPGAVRLELEFTWPWRASEKKRNRALGRIPHTSRPDVDNIAKTFVDRLVALRFLEDDNAVAELRLRKWWGDNPGIAILIESLDAPAVARATTDASLFEDQQSGVQP